MEASTQRERTRARILEAARARFSQAPFDEVGMEQVARAAGVSKALVHHYYGTKRALYLEVLRAVADDFVASTAPPEGEPPEARLAEGIRRYLDFVAAQPRAFAALVGGGIGSSDDAAAALIAEVRRRFCERIQSRLGNATPSHALDVALHTYFGAVEAASLRWIAGGATRDEVALFADRLLRAAILGALELDPDAAPELT